MEYFKNNLFNKYIEFSIVGLTLKKCYVQYFVDMASELNWRRTEKVY